MRNYGPKVLFPSAPPYMRIVYMDFKFQESDYF